MIAIDRYGWMTVVVYVLLIWVAFGIAAAWCWHRKSSGQWRPYTREEVEDPHWDERR
jgi:hypothetical protein